MRSRNDRGRERGDGINRSETKLAGAVVDSNGRTRKSDGETRDGDERSDRGDVAAVRVMGKPWTRSKFLQVMMSG